MIIKNSNLRRGLFENRYKILAIIVAIILVLCLIRVLNGFAKQSLKQSNPSSSNSSTTSNYKPQETVISGNNVSISKQDEYTKLMDKFIEYCNSKEIEKAYDLLTDECKEEIFNSNMQNFKTNYVEKIFATYKTYNMKSWINASNPTYKVRILQDILSTGKTGEIIEDYYTIVKQNNINKINLNSYVGRKEINKTATKNNITITVINKDIYMDYEIYNIKVENKTDNTILLDTKTKSKTTYMTANNGVTYTAYMNEIDSVFLTIQPRIYAKLEVKVNKIYSPNIIEESLSFTDIITNLEEYNKTKNKEGYNRETIIVKL